jgi:Ribonuclease G/E
LISALPGEIRAAWLDGERLVDLVVQRESAAAAPGDLYLGRIAQLDKTLDAAFVELGLARPGLLPRSEAPGQKLIEGEALALRVTRAATGDKGVRLSARMADSPADLQDRIWGLKPPAQLARGDDLITRALAATPVPEEIVIDDPATFAKVKRLAAVQGQPDVTLDLDPLPLFERAGVEAEIEALLGARVELPSGGFLLVEPVTSLTAIDVNSGGHKARGGYQRTAQEVNLEAAEEIPRQLRLRALGGLMVVDFLPVTDQGARRKVVERLRAGLAQDSEPCQASAMTHSGLVEVTRRRSRPALHEVLTAPCGLDGSGRIKTAATVAFEALRAARREAATRPGAQVVLRGSRSVIAALEKSPALGSLEDRLGRALELEVDPMLDDGDYQIVLD